MRGKIRCIFDNCKKWELLLWWVFRLLMIEALVRLLMDSQVHGNPLQMFVNLLLMFVWEIFMLLPQKSFLTLFPSYGQDILVIMLFLTSYCGAYLNLYYKVWWWDTMLHAIGGGLCVFLGYELISAYQKKQDCSSLALVLLCSFCFSFFLSTIWEIFEFTMDQVTHSDIQHWSLALAQEAGVVHPVFDPGSPERFALMDTMSDMIMNTIGAVVSVIILKICPYHHKK